MSWQWVFAAAVSVGAVSGAIYAVVKPLRKLTRWAGALGSLLDAQLRENHGSSLVDRVGSTHERLEKMEPVLAEVPELRADVRGMQSSLDANYDRLNSYRDQVMGFAEDRRALAGMVQAVNDRLDKVKDWGTDQVNPKLAVLSERLDGLELIRKVLDTHEAVVRAVTATHPADVALPEPASANG